MRKIILASHHNLAKGMKETLEYIMPNLGDVTTIAAYTANTPVDQEIDSALADLTDTDEAIIFTDLLGGSVNQNFIRYLSLPNIHVITGMNLPVIMACLLPLGEEAIDPENLRQGIKEGREQLIYVNDFLTEQTIDEEDE
ncbi:PTS N-acetylglucosamine transporter subunit IIBC [Enterococcus sp. ALS3]|uniref:PTS N-acetylglucosamine transporter subunit IIBC n=1 Tax=Enterococcus alishanensis TaxID=1303817 RepID=A0ABS6TH19_9ENTE|nr:PTS N-acetylglucosamine transporter subunit IIBC [Enterococcus alishanensis]MBV7392109.1 PTS N-acetylglucosamine transporter subunit IIBC [Enterococcus alishanensis]